MTCTCGRPTEDGALLCEKCAYAGTGTRVRLSQFTISTADLDQRDRAFTDRAFTDLEDDAMPPGAEGSD